jgi:hypothetical protein
MKTFKSISDILFLTVLLAACESPVANISPEKLPQSESKLVVNSVISPQLPYITVLVNESKPLFSNSDATEEPIDDATVRISDGVNEMAIPYDAVNKVYSLKQAKFPILASKTYFLTVSDGKRTVNAQCTVPGNTAAIKSYEFDTLLLDNPIRQDTAVTLKMTWQDIPSDTNYYKVNAVMDLDYSILLLTNQQAFKEERISGHFNFNWNWQEGKNEFLSDNHLNGALLSSPIGRILLPEVNERTDANGKKMTVYPKTKIKSVTMEVYNLDVNYYKYQRSLEIRNNSDSPFAEPTSIYTNVIGGLGCFAAYNAAQIKLTF